MNKGVVLITPVVLVRFLSVTEFGQYREFLVYAGLLTSLAAFGITSSLLRFVPETPKAAWRFVDHTVWMTFAGSILVVAGMWAVDAMLPAPLVGDYVVPLTFYVLFFVNVDHWQYLWIAQKRGLAVLGYTTGRLLARVVVVTLTAILTRDVATVIWSLVCFEGLRLALSTVSWRINRRRQPQDDAPDRSWWREVMEYCLPYGGALVTVTINRSMGSIFVAKWLGPVALAHYSIGLYVQPVLTVIRNSLSDVILPEIVSRKTNQSSPAERLRLWQRTTVVTVIFLFAAGVLLARFADVLVVTLFSEEYRPAVIVFQIYLLVLLREGVDLGIPLRAMNRNKPILYSNLIGIAVNVVLMFALMPVWGVAGAVAALVASRFVDGAYLTIDLTRAYHLPLRALLPWKDLFKILGAAVLAGVVLYGEFWVDHFGLLGVILGGLAYIAIFSLLLLRSNIPEVALLLDKLRAVPGMVLRKPN